MSFGKKIILLMLGISILIFTCSVTTALINIREALTVSAEKKISEVTEIAYNIIAGYKTRVDEGKMTEAEAKSMALEDLKNIKYQGKNYIWVMDYDSKYLYHPTRPVGFDGKTLTNKKGEHYIETLTENAINNKEIFLKDASAKPGDPSKKKYPKIMYARAFSDWQWIVATGIYIDEIDTMTFNTFVRIFAISFIAASLILLILSQSFVKRLIAMMNSLSNALRRTSEEVSSASENLESSSNVLADGSNRQASAIQETSATIEETASMVRQNNENTKQATILSRNTKQYADESTDATQKMMETMNELEVSSHEISKIIKAIDDIAFQTNILSLNAAVEAARAGDAGQGFAVVAEEVRNLAQKSAQAAKNTESIIEHNINLSKQGFEMAKEVETSLTKINDEVKKVDELLNEIAVATNEQAQGVDQINKAITQMEEALQTNAGTAENTSSASRQLLAQSSSMDNIVGELSSIINGNN